MVKTFKKGEATKLSANFKSSEFDCHGNDCCTETMVDERLVEFLQNIRDHFGKPVNVNSGYRCATHNTNVGGASKSRHMSGCAADIAVTGVEPKEVAAYAETIGMKGIGLYTWGCHVDIRDTKSFWYGDKQEPRTTFGGTPPVEEVAKEELYRVRKGWEDTKSQKGAYKSFDSATECCQEAGEGYRVFDWNGNEVYVYTAPVVEEPEPEITEEPETEEVMDEAVNEETAEDIVDEEHHEEDSDVSVYSILALLKKLIKAIKEWFNS